MTSDATFRAWVLALRTALTDAGIIRTSDTGQIDPTTVTSPAANGFGGYDIFRFPDSADQTAFPVFFKLEYGKSSASAARQGLRLTIGTASDGAGVINRNADTAQPLQASTANPAGLAYLGVSYFDGALILHSPIAAVSQHEEYRTSFLIERIRKRVDGLATRGIQVMGWTSSAITPNFTRLFNGGWGTGYIGHVPASMLTSSRMVLGGFFQADFASPMFRGVAFSRSGVLTVGDVGTVVAEDGTVLTYKKVSSFGQQAVSVNGSSTVLHDILLRSA